MNMLRRHWPWLLVLIVLLALPFLFYDWSRGRHSGFVLTLLSEIGVMAIFALSYNMLMGQAGLLSFGHAVLFGLGAYCAAHGIRDTVTFIHESSDVALAAGRGIPEALDFVLIDGAHRFPFPILDWHFTEPRLRVGGIVAVDDYPMPSVKILHDFLIGEDEWELIQRFQRTAFFRRRRETVNVWDWADQKINEKARKAFVNGQDRRFLHRLRKWMSPA